MHILISNDDGIYAQGIRILAKALQTIADVTVVAPDRNRSGASNSLTLANPLRIKQIEPNFYSVEGTPTDCVHLALTGLMDKQPDMVVSGINAGSNLGDDVLYSGTVAAAIEGRFLGLPSIAVSLTSLECRHFETAAMIAKELVLRLQTDPLPGQTILNVNVPDIPISDVKGIAVTRLGARHKAESVLKTVDPRGEPIYWFGPPGAEADAGSGTDFYAINNRYVSVTPLSVDLTHYKVFDQLAGWMNGIDL